jgi:hypothetical protein
MNLSEPVKYTVRTLVNKDYKDQMTLEALLDEVAPRILELPYDGRLIEPLEFKGFIEPIGADWPFDLPIDNCLVMVFEGAGYPNE